MSKTKGKVGFNTLWPFGLFAVLWAVFAVWICYREEEYAWLVLLIIMGLIPLIWKIFFSPFLEETIYVKGNSQQTVSSDVKPILSAPEQNISSEISLLSAKGRIRRTTYWLRIIACFAINIISVVAFGPESLAANLISIPVGVFAIIQGVKRMHDVNKSGWYIIIPIYNLVLAFTDGTPGTNKYGDDPKGREIDPES